MDGTWWKTTAAEAAAVGHPWPYRAHAANISFGTRDVTHETATEFWPGSHFDFGPARTNKPRDPAGHVAAVSTGADRRRSDSPPIQLTVPKGAFCIRDWRCARHTANDIVRAADKFCCNFIPSDHSVCTVAGIEGWRTVVIGLGLFQTLFCLVLNANLR
eukprot:COSAG06_NODE_12591_length_1359_cov_1.320635_1_plen_159_part_00